ncbi:MAG TPA: ABC transporter, partial [Candidatus Competibacteraceae bacterium]|nr:ABC transporter [Candidatus Competibacteraceae bacterium]
RRQQLAIKRKPLDQQIRTLEQRMDLLHREQKTLDAALADPASYDEANKNRLREWLLRKGEVDRELAALETQWLEVQGAIEALAADLT